MRSFLLFILLLPVLFFAQKSKSDSTFEYTYFKNGKISTKRLILNESIRFGYLKAYKLDGIEIYSMSTRNVGGHASVGIDFYPNGAIQKAHATSQPDGGIQRGDITHYFDELGNITSIIDMSDDGHGRTVTAPTLRQIDPIVQPKKVEKEVIVKCAVIYSTDIYVVNLTRKPQTVLSQKTPSNGLNFITKQTINPGDTVKFGSYIEAQLFTPASTLFSVSIESKKKKHVNSILLVWDVFVQHSTTLRKYHLLLVDTKVK